MPRHHGLRLLIFLILLGGFACGDSSSTAVTGPETTRPSTAIPATAATVPVTTTAPVTTTPVTTTAPAETTPCGEAQEGFISRGGETELGMAEGSGTHLADIELSEHQGCERLLITLADAGGNPAAGVPPVQAHLDEETGLLRITFDDRVRTTSITDLESSGLVERVYVVRGLDGRMFVDVHLASFAAARVRAGESPGQLVVDLRPEGGTPARQPAVSQFVVVTRPLAGSVAYPLEVTGYSRTFEANVLGWLVDPQGVETGYVITSAADYIEMWGEFRLRIDEGPDGPAVLMVGDFEPRDGEFKGVTIDLDLR